jgi:hypothetical protein
MDNLNGDATVEPELESDPKLQDWANREQCALFAFVAPYSGIRVSPIQEAYASIGMQEEFGIESFIERCHAAKIKKLHILVNSPGGSIVSSYKVAKALRSQFKEIRVFVPHMAASGGALIALTGDEIVMGRLSNLTPLDPQVHYKGTVISSNSFLRCFDRFKKAFGQWQPEEAPYPIRCMTEKLDPLLMEEMSGTTATCMLYVAEILQMAGYSEADAVDKAGYLVTNFRDHSTVLDRDRLEGKKFKVVADSKYRSEWEEMRRWLRMYITRSESVHHMRYCLPKKKHAAARDLHKSPRQGRRKGDRTHGQSRKEETNGRILTA